MNNIKAIIGISFILLCVTVAVLIQEPIPQPLEYHIFADNRVFLSVPNFLNVISNLLFIIVGGMGLYSLLQSKKINLLAELYAGYLFLFLGLVLIGLGSGYYHL